MNFSVSEVYYTMIQKETKDIFLNIELNISKSHKAILLQKRPEMIDMSVQLRTDELGNAPFKRQSIATTENINSGVNDINTSFKSGKFTTCNSLKDTILIFVYMPY